VTIDQLVSYSLTDRFSLPREKVLDLQLRALSERFAELVHRVRLLTRLADEQGVRDIVRLEDAAPLLLRNSVYKSYPLSLLDKSQFDRLTLWLDAFTTHDLSKIDACGCTSIDDWIDLLQAATEIRVIHSSGTSGKLSFLPRSQAEIRLMVEIFKRHCEGFGNEPDAGPIEHLEEVPILFPSYRYGAMEANRLIDGFVQYVFGGAGDRVVTLNPGRMSADALSLGGRLQGAEARGERGRTDFAPHLLKRREEFLKQQAQAPARFQAFFTAFAERFRGRRVMVLSSGWGQLYDMAVAGHGRGIRGVLAPNSLIMIGGGIKGRVFPPDYQEIVRDFLGVPAMRDGYGMSECLASTRSCPQGKYHLQPWTVPYLLDPQSGAQLPRTGTQRGHLGLLDLLPRSYWGGFLTGDDVTLSWGDSEPCPCGRIGPYIHKDIRRFSEKQGGDDKITCAGAAEAHDRALDFINQLV